MMSDFIEWRGSPARGNFPPGVVDTTKVEVRFRNGQIHQGCAQSFGWSSSDYYPASKFPEVGIVAYRVIEEAE